MIVSCTGQGWSLAVVPYLEGAVGEAVLRDWVLLSFSTSKLLVEILIPSVVSLSTDICYRKLQYLHFMVGILIFTEIRCCLSLTWYKGKVQTSKLNFPFQG